MVKIKNVLKSTDAHLHLSGIFFVCRYESAATESTKSSIHHNMMANTKCDVLGLHFTHNHGGPRIRVCMAFHC